MGQCFSAAVKVVQEVVAESTQQEQQQPHKQEHAAGTSSTGGTSDGVLPSTGAGGGGLSPIYLSLPEDAEQVDVRNVYDGDTLTLRDERRVRFLGIDTPEIKEHQPFSQEAKAYTKDRCSGKIWISFAAGQEREDHYGRLLAFVWVKEAGGYLCVNEGIVAAGLASAYLPNQSCKLHNWNKLVALQNQAREASRGMWNNFQDENVFKTVNGAAYHKRSCDHLSRSYNLTELKASEAAAKGLHPCRTCMA